MPGKFPSLHLQCLLLTVLAGRRNSTSIGVTLGHSEHFSLCAEHRNMPQADAMVLVARNYERYKTESREKEREEIARQAAKMADEAILQERERPPPMEEGVRGGHSPRIQTLLNLLADNRYVTAEEIDKVIDYLRDRKERLLRGSTESLQGKSHSSRQTLLCGVWSSGLDRKRVLGLQRSLGA